jgi:flagellar biosynthesis protein FlhG
MENMAQIIPIASGKGGVGKSILASNLAAVLAQKGKKVVAIDLDLGGSNLYSYLGLNNTYKGIGDYLKEKKPLKEYLVQTPYNNLYFLPGEGRTPFLANIHYAQKIKLIKEIKLIDADYIILDLGAGTSYNTLDFFRMVKDGIIITTFAYPAIMNTLSFIKNFLIRIILDEIKVNHSLTEKVKNAFNINPENTLTYSEISGIISEFSNELAQKVDDEYKSYIPKIVFNFGRAPEDLRIVEKIDTPIKKIMSIDVHYFGYIPFDEKINESVQNKKLFIESYSDSLATGLLNNIATKIMNNQAADINNSKKDLVIETYDYIKNWIL